MPKGDLIVDGDKIDITDYPATLTALWLGLLNNDSFLETTGEGRYGDGPPCYRQAVSRWLGFSFRIAPVHGPLWQRRIGWELVRSPKIGLYARLRGEDTPVHSRLTIGARAESQTVR